jgi:isopentenyl-diphosphate delta-isomerase
MTVIPFYLICSQCAEHLKPGETYEEGAMRGMEEELNIPQGKTKTLLQLVKVIPSEYINLEKGLKDNEFAAVFTINYNGDFKIDDDEVVATKWIPFAEIKHQIEKNPGEYTPWFQKFIKLVHL